MKITITIEKSERKRRKKKRKEKKQHKTLNIILLCLGVFVLAFVIAMIVIFCIYGSVPDTLIQMVLGAGGLEALLTATITISKLWRNKDTEVNQNENLME